MARLDQALLQKVATRVGKNPKYIREQTSRRASREGVASEVALVGWARDLGIGVASAVRRLPAHLQQQLAVPRVLPAGPAGAVSRSRPGQPRRRGRRRQRSTPTRQGRRKWVFVSHSSKDKKLASQLVDLLRAALNIPAERILATSVEGYRLKGGADTDPALRDAVLDCKTLVGVITPASWASAYVLFELGARWGTGKPLIPLTACGIAAAKLGPLGGKNALDCNSKGDVLQFVGDVGTELKMEAERGEVFQKHVDRIVRTSRAGRASRRPR